MSPERRMKATSRFCLLVGYQHLINYLGDRYLLHLNRLKAANHSIDVDFAARLPPLADQRATFKEQK
jgi:hypothetical protein